jgi:predicted hydrocarbon binding protein
MALGWLARQMAEPGGQVTVHHDDRRLTLVDHEADACYGRARESEICWESLGEIQAALVWATGRHYDVTETACRAKGEPACRFEVGQALMADTD